jgi:hypothetical protein
MLKLFARSARALRIARDSFQFPTHEQDLNSMRTGLGKNVESILLIESNVLPPIRYNVQPRSAIIAGMCGECLDQCGADPTIAETGIYVHVQVTRVGGAERRKGSVNNSVEQWRKHRIVEATRKISGNRAVFVTSYEEALCEMLEVSSEPPPLERGAVLIIPERLHCARGEKNLINLRQDIAPIRLLDQPSNAHSTHPFKKPAGAVSRHLVQELATIAG